MSAILEKVVNDAVTGGSDIIDMIGRTELQFELWFNYFVDKIGKANFFNRVQTFDDFTFNVDGYQPTILPVVNNLLEGMTSIGVDVIKPSVTTKAESELMEEVYGTEVEEDLTGMLWILFTVVEPKHPLKGVRYATAYRDGELTYPVLDPQFTDTYPDEKVHGQARGIFIDIHDKFMKAVRTDIFKVDQYGKLLP